VLRPTASVVGVNANFAAVLEGGAFLAGVAPKHGDALGW